jgi:trehalose 6-phosphate synthase
MDLTSALIVNPYNIDEVVSAIKKGLEMSKGEKRKRIRSMARVLDEKNIYDWAEEFVRSSLESKQ